MIITNHSQNSTIPETFKYLSIALHTFDHKVNLWRLVDKVNFSTNGIAVITSKEYCKKKGDLIVASIQNINQKIDKYTSILPDCSVKKNDFSPHTVRCRLLFRKQGSFSSYMSEYPKRMTLIKSGSAFSYGHLLSHQNKLASTLIIFVNICNENIKNSNQYIKLIDVISNRTIFRKTISANKVTVQSIKNNKIKNKSLALVAQGLSGIPIYISEYKDRSGRLKLSCEHSHPPTEYFFNNSIQNQKTLKNNWFKKLI